MVRGWCVHTREKGHLRGLLIEEPPALGTLRHLGPHGTVSAPTPNRRLRMREQVVIPVGMGGFTPFEAMTTRRSPSVE